MTYTRLRVTFYPDFKSVAKEDAKKKKKKKTEMQEEESNDTCN